jgi:hypothetical protein
MMQVVQTLLFKKIEVNKNLFADVVHQGVVEDLLRSFLLS